MGLTQHRHAVADDLRDHQPAADARHDRQARRRAVPGARALQRPGRPHHGHLGEDARGRSWPRWTRGSASSARASTAATPSTPSARCATGAPRCSSAWAATSRSATPDTEVTEAALRSCALTVQVSTKLNRSHVVHGRTALILPSLGRTDRDVQAGVKQQVSVEDSMSMVHLSRGSLHPPSDQVRSEVAIVCAAGPRAARPRPPGAVGASSTATTTASATRSRPWCPAATTTTRKVRAARRVPAAAPAARLPRIPHQHRQSQLRGQPARVGAGTRRAGWSCRPCAATTSTTPPSTASTTATAA